MTNFFWYSSGQFKSKSVLNNKILCEVPPSHLKLFWKLTESTGLTADNALFGILRNLHPSGNSPFPECCSCIAPSFSASGKAEMKGNGQYKCLHDIIIKSVTCQNLCLTGWAHLARSHMCVNYSKKTNKMSILKTNPTNRKWLSSCDKMFIRKCFYTIQNISCL